MDKVNQWLSLIANLGVIAGVLFVGWEIQQNTEQMRAEIAHEIMSSLREAGQPLTELSTADIYARGVADPDTLSDAEKYQFNAITAAFFRVFEEAFLHYREGRLEEAYWQSISGQLERVLRTPGIRQNWQQTQGSYNPAFREWGDSLIRDN